MFVVLEEELTSRNILGHLNNLEIKLVRERDIKEMVVVELEKEREKQDMKLEEDRKRWRDEQDRKLEEDIYEEV